MDIKKQKISFGSLAPFELYVEYINQINFPIEKESKTHIHNTFEIYFNLSGDVSFVVENHTYPISRGNVILTKPFEYHHCVIHDNKEHEHYCLRFSGSEQDELFLPFHQREKGKNNHIAFTEDQIYSLKRHFDALLNLSEDSSIEKYYHLIRIFQIIQNQSAIPNSDFSDHIPQNLHKILDIIAEQYATPITVATLAAEIFVSVNTLERYFKRYLNITPSEYIKRKRLSEAMLLLNSNTSVSQVAYKCGFPDSSNFIQIFKRTFGQTPYQYMKNHKQ